jgi:hypothetical protein
VGVEFSTHRTSGMLGSSRRDSPSDRWDRTTLATDGGMSSNGISSPSISATGTLRKGCEGSPSSA